MNKKKLSTICNIVSIVLVITFVIKSVINYFQYNPMTNSAPFYVWIITNALFLLIPALLIFTVGYIINKH